jgi:hypothetical protein
MTLYTKETTAGGKVRYVPYQPEHEDIELDDNEILAIAATIGIALMIQYQQQIPAHKRNARKVMALENAIADLFQYGQKEISHSIVTYAMDCWNLAVMNISKGAIRV